jgi:hypothetical protein
LVMSSWEALRITCACPFPTDFTSVSDGGPILCSSVGDCLSTCSSSWGFPRRGIELDQSRLHVILAVGA